VAERSVAGLALDGVLTVVAMAIAAWEIHASPSWTVDDAFIVARYAENLGAHGVFAWNLEGPRVEGITGLLLALAETLSVLAGVVPVAAAKAIGVVALLASAPLVAGTVRRLGLPSPTAGIAAWLYLSVPEHVIHTTSGLETEVFAALSLAAAWSFVAALDTSSTRLRTLAVLATVLALVRPEGTLVGLVLLGLSLHHHRSRPPAVFRALVVDAVVGFVVPLLVLHVARVAYFGSLLPNTYYAKRASSWNAAYLRGLGSLANGYLVDVLVMLAAVRATSALVGMPPRPAGSTAGSPTSARLVLVAGALIVGPSAIVFARSEPIMNFANRFAFHFAPWIILGASIALGAVVVAVRSAWSTSRGFALVLGALALIVLGGTHTRAAERRREHREFMSGYAGMTGPATAAAWIAANLPKTATLACYPDAGFVAYETRLHAIDFGRLNDAYLAHETRSPREIADYFFASAPDALVISRVDDEHTFDDGGDAILHDPRFAAAFRRIGRYGTPGGFGLDLWARK
jgi:hypothetical protein